MYRVISPFIFVAGRQIYIGGRNLLGNESKVLRGWGGNVRVTGDIWNGQVLYIRNKFVGKFFGADQRRHGRQALVLNTTVVDSCGFLADLADGAASVFLWRQDCQFAAFPVKQPYPE